jgi:hypothetical protein
VEGISEDRIDDPQTQEEIPGCCHEILESSEGRLGKTKSGLSALIQAMPISAHRDLFGVVITAINEFENTVCDELVVVACLFDFVGWDLGFQMAAEDRNYLREFQGIISGAKDAVMAAHCVSSEKKEEFSHALEELDSACPFDETS